MDERVPAALAIATAALVLGLAAWLGTPTQGDTPETWHVEHWDSRPIAGDTWNETLLLRSAPKDVSLERLVFMLDGEAIAGLWVEDPPCAKFLARLEYVDFQRPLSLHHDGEEVWAGSFGSGAGTPAPPCR